MQADILPSGTLVRITSGYCVDAGSSGFIGFDTEVEWGRLIVLATRKLVARFGNLEVNIV